MWIWYTFSDLSATHKLVRAWRLSPVVGFSVPAERRKTANLVPQMMGHRRGSADPDKNVEATARTGLP